jgi:succinyl-diaminopimelate desuccinylase
LSGQGSPEAVSLADPVALARALIRCASVTPEDGGAQDLLAGWLVQLGFTVIRLPFGTTPNLFARLGTGGRHLCFAGHTDVVPPGEGWSSPPFAGEIRDGMLVGRGACDMKGAIAAFVAACASRLAQGPHPGSISLLLTGDEEGPALDGTVKVLEWMEANGHIPDFCVVGEPTNPTRLGDMIKVGRRGSLNARIAVHGIQGHAAYPQRADNPAHRLVRALAALIAAPLDAGSDLFEPSSLQITSIDIANPASNVIPGTARAMLNIRFNDRHTGTSLGAWLRAAIARHADRFDLDISVSGESFLTPAGPELEQLQRAVEAATGIAPQLDTGGGTSDARFITRLCPVAEFGLVGRSMHQVDESVALDDLRALSRIYAALIGAFAA